MLLNVISLSADVPNNLEATGVSRIYPESSCSSGGNSLQQQLGLCVSSSSRVTGYSTASDTAGSSTKVVGYSSEADNIGSSSRIAGYSTAADNTSSRVAGFSFAADTSRVAGFSSPPDTSRVAGGYSSAADNTDSSLQFHSTRGALQRHTDESRSTLEMGMTPIRPASVSTTTPSECYRATKLYFYKLYILLEA